MLGDMARDVTWLSRPTPGALDVGGMGSMSHVDLKKADVSVEYMKLSLNFKCMMMSLSVEFPSCPYPCFHVDLKCLGP